MDFTDLNPQQLAATRALDGPVLVLAGAGTGKTSVITYRIAALLRNGVDAEHLLAVTFTNKAAQEMRERIHGLLPSADIAAMAVSTIHSFCCRVLRRDIHHLGFSRRFGIADAGDQDSLTQQLMGEMGLAKGEFDANFFKNGISHAKNHIESPDDVGANSRRDIMKILADLYARYQTVLKNMNLLDFDDLLLFTVRLWQEHPDVLEQYRDRYRYILVDEYQDTNRVQSELLRLLSGPSRNICVVGDDDQSIYAWRGADIRNILEFTTTYPKATVIKLEQNYRSTKAILEAASDVISRNEDRHAKRLWSTKPEGDRIRYFEAEDEISEARLVADLIRETCYGPGISFNDIAVLFRSNHQTRPFEEAMRDHGLPYRIVGAKSFYERREIRDAVAYLRILHNDRDDLSLLRIINVPARGVGDKSIEKLKQMQTIMGEPLLAIIRKPDFLNALAARGRSNVEAFIKAYDAALSAFTTPGYLARKLLRYLSDIDYIPGLGKVYKNRKEARQRSDNVVEFVNSAALFEERLIERALPRDDRSGGGATLQSFLEAFSLTDDRDRTEEKTEADDGVTLLTVHAAKGLEFACVIIIGMEQNMFPHERSINDFAVDEERRLFYVAMTRAQDHLVLTRAVTRTRFNRRAVMQPSQFIAELPEHLVQQETPEAAFSPASSDQVSTVISKMKERFG